MEPFASQNTYQHSLQFAQQQTAAVAPQRRSSLHPAPKPTLGYIDKVVEDQEVYDTISDPTQPQEPQENKIYYNTIEEMNYPTAAGSPLYWLIKKDIFSPWNFCLNKKNLKKIKPYKIRKENILCVYIVWMS